MGSLWRERKVLGSIYKHAFIHSFVVVDCHMYCSDDIHDHDDDDTKGK